jgi:hypothetical protein
MYLSIRTVFIFILIIRIIINFVEESFLKADITQLVKKLPAFLWKVHYGVRKSPPLVPILNQLSPVHTPTYLIYV